MTSGQTSYSMEHTSTSSSSNSTSSQGTVNYDSTELPGWQSHQKDDGDQPSQATALGDESLDSNSSPQFSQPSPTVKENHEEEPEYIANSPLPTNTTVISDSSPSDTPTPTLNCPGPFDPATGEAYLDPDGNCAIACYNNLVLNDAGDACVCAPTFQFDPVEVKCICASPYVLRHGKCVLLPSQAARARHSNKKRSLNAQVPLGVEMLHGKYPRTDLDRLHCPDSEIACPMQSNGYECLDPDVTLENCGGCAATGKGVNCNNITMAGLVEVGCSAGVCVAINCLPGFRAVDGTCIRNPRR
ncbi:hypothetical protein PCANC_02836 [Puccinia coronata f. sp. avenae]|uniref:Protein CPL1-like domain-containing protein n=2 Tax=Puccinia coronata f. sp. avenae TaxID=200324 RepID=A0A2N5W415_9BASI|nr:hypothetical protein PCANC_14261 [Puccinia coronata f. sp. avenae]PLW57008.1 hypothetical protein PCANC_02836 [Puccinia coronata f. sp. avenae]